MMTVSIGKADASCVDKVTLTSGMVNAVQVTFAFSSEWEGFDKIAVFSNGSTSIDISLEDDDRCHIPHEVLAVAGKEVTCGVYGSKDGVALPTVKCSLGKVVDGADPSGEESAEPTPSMLVDHENRISALEKSTGTGEHTHDLAGYYEEAVSLNGITTYSGMSGHGGITDNTLTNHAITQETFTIDIQGKVNVLIHTSYDQTSLYVDGVRVDHTMNLEDLDLEYSGEVKENIQVSIPAKHEVTFETFTVQTSKNGFMTGEQAGHLANTPTTAEVESLINNAFGIVAQVFDEVHEYAESLGGDEA